MNAYKQYINKAVISFSKFQSSILLQTQNNFKVNFTKSLTKEFKRKGVRRCIHEP